MSDIPSVLATEIEDNRDRRLTLTLGGMEPIKSSSRTQLPAWQPDALLISYRYREGRWTASPFAMLRGRTLDGITNIAEPIGEHDDRWPWVSALIDNYMPVEREPIIEADPFREHDSWLSTEAATLSQEADDDHA
jgi:hypothetical protein